MATRHLLVLPAQELAELQLAAAQSPQFAYLLKKLPCFRAALAHPLPDLLNEVSNGAREAAWKAQEGTRYPEDWDELLAQAATLQATLHASNEAQATAVATHQEPASNSAACRCCGSTRYASGYSRGVDQNQLRIPHLDFNQEDGYLPFGLGIPGGSDGICIQICLDCGLVRNGSYPLTDEALKTRIEERTA